MVECMALSSPLKTIKTTKIRCEYHSLLAITTGNRCIFAGIHGSVARMQFLNKAWKKTDISKSPVLSYALKI